MGSELRIGGGAQNRTQIPVIEARGACYHVKAAAQYLQRYPLASSARNTSAVCFL